MLSNHDLETTYRAVAAWRGMMLQTNNEFEAAELGGCLDALKHEKKYNKGRIKGATEIFGVVYENISKVQAIKLHKWLTDEPLIDCKNYIDSLAKEHNWQSPAERDTIMVDND